MDYEKMTDKDRHDRLEARWVPVTDRHGETRMEARWITVSHAALTSHAA